MRVFISFLIFLFLAILSIIGLSIYSAGPMGLFLLALVMLVGVISLFWFYRFKSYGKMVFSLSLVLVLAFSTLSGDVLPFVNRYPMKKFANYINRENIKGPIGIYKLGNNRARLGVLTGRRVVEFHSYDEIVEFLNKKQKVFLVIKKSDWEKEISNIEMKILEKDQIGIKANLLENGIVNHLNIKKLRETLNMAETLYFLSI